MSRMSNRPPLIGPIRCQLYLKQVQEILNQVQEFLKQVQEFLSAGQVFLSAGQDSRGIHPAELSIINYQLSTLN